MVFFVVPSHVVYNYSGDAKQTTSGKSDLYQPQRKLQQCSTSGVSWTPYNTNLACDACGFVSDLGEAFAAASC